MVQKAEQNLTLVIGNKNYSSWSLRPWIFLKKIGIPFREKRVALFTETSNDELAQYQSNYKVPVLLHDDFVVWDSLSILEYLSESFLQGSGWPENKKARAYARSMSAEMHSSFEALRTELPMNCRKQFDGINLSNEAVEDVMRVTTLWGKCHDMYGSAGPWLAGKFSIVDAMYIPVALRLAGYNIPFSGFAGEYINTVLNDTWVKDWIKSAREEKEVIEDDEIETV